MKTQTQWLFEVPITPGASASSFELGNNDWGIAIKPGSIRRPIQQSQTTRPTAPRIPSLIRRVPTSPGVAQSPPRLTNGRSFALGQPSQPPPRPGLALTYNDVRSDRIDVFAQQLLLWMSKNPAMLADAHNIVMAVKSGKLGGIYKEDQKVPALRARAINSSWERIIPKGEGAVLFLDPQKPKTGIPILVFRDSIRADRVQFHRALQKAWQAYSLWRAGKIIPQKYTGSAQREFEIMGTIGNWMCQQIVRIIRPSSICIDPGSSESFATQTANKIRHEVDQNQFENAFFILNGLSMRDMLDTLRVLDGFRTLTGLSYLDLLKQNIESAAKFYKNRIDLALKTVSSSRISLDMPDSLLRGIITGFNEFSVLPKDQQDDIVQFLKYRRWWIHLSESPRQENRAIRFTTNCTCNQVDCACINGVCGCIDKQLPLPNSPSLTSEHWGIIDYMVRARNNYKDRSSDLQSAKCPPGLCQNPNEVGFMYGGSSSVEPQPSLCQTHNPAAKCECWASIRTSKNGRRSEGGASAINTYDGQILTWGSGFSAQGVLPQAVQYLFANDAIAHQKLLDIGINLDTTQKIRSHWWQIVDIENGLIEKGLNAVRLTQFDRKMLSALIEISEDPLHTQNWIDAQFRAFRENITAWTSLKPCK